MNIGLPLASSRRVQRTSKPLTYNAHAYDYTPPLCARNTNKSYCLKDEEYPVEQIEKLANKYYDKLFQLYADVANLSVSNSVDLHPPRDTRNETYLCSSEILYARPLRAINIDGKWRIIVNGIKVHYEILTQTTRIEECLKNGQPCPLIPTCTMSKCLQKSVYHRFLIYDPYQPYFPFAIESFKLPASCGCLIGATDV